MGHGEGVSKHSESVWGMGRGCLNTQSQCGAWGGGCLNIQSQCDEHLETTWQRALMNTQGLCEACVIRGGCLNTQGVGY